MFETDRDIANITIVTLFAENSLIKAAFRIEGQSHDTDSGVDTGFGNCWGVRVTKRRHIGEFLPLTNLWGPPKEVGGWEGGILTLAPLL